ncbi:MAG: M28 family peptidase, partial [Acidobacteriota bacterium]|nr:M28 family peptidase [Acidobacteriota bacterium]
MRRTLAVLLPLAVVLALAFWRVNGPAPKAADAPPNEFAAARAVAALQELLQEGVPHPIASPANARVRARIEARMRSLGYEVTVQRRFACNAGASCAMVENILARLPGPTRGDVVLVSAHYDSVAAGPGASDDGQGVATLLEVARAARGERFRNRVAFLFTDGEEAGLLGAEGFVSDANLLRDVAVVINVDMRGTYGPSNMFETSRGNRWLIRHLANALDRPQATSLFYAVYTLLPNDTDVTVFKRAEKAAVNFAAIRGVNWYHTPLDDRAHASPRTIQHHGDNVLGMLRVLGNADLAARSTTDATYFDVLNFYLVWWPQEWTLWIAVISLLALLIAARRTDARAMTFGVLAAFCAILIAAVGGFAIAKLATLQSSDFRFVARSLMSVAAMWLTGIAAALLACAIFNRRDNARALLYGIAIVWHAMGIALALTLGGAAYLFIVPAVAVTVCAWARANETTTAAVAATVAAILFFPIAILLYDVLGSPMLPASALLIALLATLVAPLFARLRNGVAAATLAIVCALVAIAQPSYTADRPRIAPLAYVDDARAAAPRWSAWTVTDYMRKVIRFAPGDASLTPWDRGSAYHAPAPQLGAPRVTVAGSRNGTTVMVRVRSPRHASRLAL